MNKFSIITTSLATLAAAGMGLAGAAAATGESAADTINSLQAQGYHVNVNYPRTPPGSLSQCIVTGVHGLPRGHTDAPQFITVYVDISCPPDNN